MDKKKAQHLQIRVSQSEIQTFGSGNSSTTDPNKKSGIPSPEETQSPSPQGGGDPGAPDSGESDDAPVGVIYARVSSDDQVNRDGDCEENPNQPSEGDKGSIQGQISQLKGVAEDQGITLPYDPIVDEAQTGTNFDRDGIRRVFELSKREQIDYLLVEKIDRIGRNAAETLYFISVLQRQCGVTLLTLGGERDIDQVEGLMHTTLLSLMAEVQNQIRTEKATNERIRGFLKNKNWNCVSPKIPLGYSETADGWLEVDPEEQPIVREIFRKFVACETYAVTRNHIEETFGDAVLEGHQLKTILQESTYIGRPKVPEQWIVDSPFENDLHEPELNLLTEEYDDDREVSPETFWEAQRIIESNQRESENEDEPYSVSDFVDEFGLFAVLESSDLVRLVHHCGEPMVKDGQADLGGNFDLTTHRYRCPKCEEKVDPESYSRKWPRQTEINDMEIINEIQDGNFPLFESGTEDNDSDTDD